MSGERYDGDDVGWADGAPSDVVCIENACEDNKMIASVSAMRFFSWGRR